MNLTDDELAVKLAPLLWDIKESRIEHLNWNNQLVGVGTTYQPGRYYCRPHPLVAQGMLDVIKAMQRLGWWCQLRSPFTADNLKWSAGFTPLSWTGWNGSPDHKAKHERPERAVAEAALKALESEARLELNQK